MRIAAAVVTIAPMRTALLLLLSLWTCCSGADLAETIRAIIESSPQTRQSFWGVRVVDAASGDVLAAVNDDKFFVPASNTKLFTTALALHRLGPDYRFRTRVAADAKPDSAGRVRELRLIGGGDPNLSGRNLPYNVNEEIGADPFAALRELADKVVAAGVHSVEGDIVGDDTTFLWEPYPPGWAIDDSTWEYGAPVSALTLNDNTLHVIVFPGSAPGMPTSIALSPTIEFLEIQNRVATVAPEAKREIRLDRLPGSNELLITGSIPANGRSWETTVAVEDPALFAAAAFKSILEERGVRVSGQARALHRSEGEELPAWDGVDLAQHDSPPLSQVLQVINKVSQNLHTEILLRQIAREKTGVGSREKGLHEISEWLTEIGVEPGQYNFEDASGLSRLTLVTPATVSGLLKAMYATPERETWIASLPIGGVDGTLKTRFEGEPNGARIHAKTGSLSHVAALSGYAEIDAGHARVFSVLVNNFNRPSAEIREVIDRIALALLE